MTRVGAHVLSAQVVPVPVVEDAPGGLVEALADALRGLDAPKGAPLSIALLPSLAPGRILAPGDAPAGGLTAEPRDHSDLDHAVVARRETTSAGEEYVAPCPHHILSEVAEGLQAGGWSADAVTPADHAWCSATEEVQGRSNGRSLCVVQVAGALPETRILAVASGAPVALRRLPHDVATSILSSVLRAIAERSGEGGEPIPLLALGDPAFRETIHAAGSAAGLAIANPNGLLADLHFDPGFVAAAFAGVGPPFVPPEIVTPALARRRRRTMGMAAAAVVLLVMAGALQTLGVSRELDAVLATRAGVRSQVEAALVMTNDADDVRDVITTLRDLRTSSPQWSGVMGDLSERLPAGTYATAVRTVGDSIFMEMEGEDAARAFENLRAMPGLDGFRAAAPVRREVGEGSKVIERFTAAATVAWPRPTDSGGGIP